MTARVGRLVVALVVVGACEKKPVVTAADGPDGLRALFVQARTACEAMTYAKGRAILEGIMPTTESLSRALVDAAPPNLRAQLVAQRSEIPADDAKAACVFAPAGRTEVLVHRATTEELAAHAPNTEAATEFPAGAQLLAPLLRPGTTFYEVETVEPGNDRGTKFHMFFWDGATWRMLGPAWRYLDAR